MIKIIDRLFFEGTWKCVYRKKETSSLNSSDNKFFEIIAARRYWCADPFIAKEKNDYYFLCEIMDRKISRGLLGAGRIRENENSKIEKIIDLGCHTSYPDVFKYKDKWYLVPETLDRKTIELYEAVEFPYKWEKISNLYENVNAVDTTIFEKNGQLFAFVYEARGNDNNLSIGHVNMETKKIDKIYKVVHYDSKLGRPAGSVYNVNGCTYRPTQYGVNFYGEKIVSKVFNFDSDTFRYDECDSSEITADKIIPNKNIVGTHTYNICGDFEIYDLLYKKFYPLRPIYLLLKKFEIGGFTFYDRDK